MVSGPSGRFSRAAGALAFAVHLGCSSVPPNGEAIVVVDTDLPVPLIVSELRVDLYETDGYWFESRDIRLPDARDWPLSFSVVAPDSASKDVLVRLRAHPEGRVRSYKGERFQEWEAYTAPFVAATVEEMC